uniref:Major facilitator superfamily associated domain-containing protein n=1 Tax=Glossina morsitans morsitans TaxID=37546 RepID=A0A1B0GBJ0_GLOMM
MVKINKRLLPIKAHFLFFMAAMGPILPQLSVLGKQIGIAPEVMGYITSVLPIMYVIAKPLFGFVADYFTKLRKLIFIGLIFAMTLAYAAFYFIPQIHNAPISLDDVWNVTLNRQLILDCKEQLVNNATLLCKTTYRAECITSYNNISRHYEAYFTDSSNPLISDLDLATNYIKDRLPLHVCLSNASILPDDLNNFESVCKFSANLQGNCIYGTTTFWLFVLFLCAGTIGFNVTNSISDAICFDMLGETEETKYGAQRVWGTIGFGLTALIAGWFVDFWTVDEVKSFTPALIIMLIFSSLDLLSVCRLKLPKLSSSESIFNDVWNLITHPAIAVFLVFATIAGIIDSFIIYFMFWHLEEVAAATGYMHQIKLIEGCVVAAECLAGEVPFFFYSGKIIKKLGYVHCMSMCFFFYAVRLFLISWIPNPWYLVLVELFFQGCTYALCYTCIVAYASAVAPPGTSATVQGLMAGMDDGLGFSIGSLLGGLAFKTFGGRRSFKYFSLVAICTCLAHILARPSSKKQQYLPKIGYQVPQEETSLTQVNRKVEIIKA